MGKWAWIKFGYHANGVLNMLVGMAHLIVWFHRDSSVDLVMGCMFIFFAGAMAWCLRRFKQVGI